MLPDVGGLEWLVIAVVALVVVGPKDLPVMLRKLGQFVAKLRNMAAEFRSSFDEMARQSELDELRKEVEAMRRGQFADLSSHDEAMRSTVGEIEQSLSDVGVQLHPPMSYQYDTTTEPPPAQVPDEPAKPARKPRAKKAAAAKVEARPIVEGGPKPKKPRARKTAEKATGAKA
ncbi:Sec-independent protein translocase protein TatB [Phenylobacterium sp.]|uniref:Sec-independent protein translocase protein TatB n=1 Tax=Phenylobacterium sp. TaxID=1871053 RepID=UPI0025D8B744|nr:Sec-independent protein translocase protein TatB [Phenylobacterium sp.]MBX3483993.1 Sec-independent protein translocase protein TatB [Phenylobacterium sp.]